MAQAKTQTLSLGEHWNGFIDIQVSQGRYASASERLYILNGGHRH